MGLDASLVAQLVKNMPAMQEAQIGSLGQKDHLEKETATHTSSLSWRIPQTEEPGKLQSMGSQRIRHDCATAFPFTCSRMQKQSVTIDSLI